MEATLVTCRDGMTVNAAARLYNIPVTTLFGRIKALIDQPVYKNLDDTVLYLVMTKKSF